MRFRTSGGLARRIGSGTWAVADQALYAGANFALNVALARALTPEAYGAFTTGFIAFLLLGAVHGGLLIEPLLVFGAGRMAPRRRDYLRWAVGAHMRVAGVIALVLAGAGAVAALAGQPVLGAALFGFALAQGGVLLHWLLRRACHLVDRPDLAAASGIVYLGLVVAGGVALGSAGWLTALGAPLLMGVASLFAACALAICLKVQASAASPLVARAAGAAHLAYGRFAAGSGVLEWAQGALPFLVLPLVAGLAGTAELRAAFNLAMPALQAGAALTVMCVPLLVRARRAGTMDVAARRAGVALAVGAGVYGLLVGFFGDVAMSWLYQGAYVAGPAVRWTLAALPLASVAAGVFAAVLRAQERPRAVLVSRMASIGIGLVATAVLASLAGVAGALAGAVATLALEAIILAWHSLRDDAPARTPAPAGPQTALAS